MKMKNKNERSMSDSKENTDNHHIVYYAVRTSLDLTPGKVAVQVGHATQLLINCRQSMESKDNYPTAFDAKIKTFDAWAEYPFRKCLLAAHDKEFERIKKDLFCVVVKEAGFTEVESGTETCVAIWPMRKSERPGFLKRMRLWQ